MQNLPNCLTIPLLAPPWLVCLLISYGLLLIFKLAFWRSIGAGMSPRATLSYLLFWIGLDPSPFLTKRPRSRLRARDWLVPVARMVVAVVMIWVVAPALWPSHPTATAWLGLTGLVLLFHFGVLDLMAQAWQIVGTPVERIMNAPYRSASLAEFWGRRWNRAFRFAAHRWIFQPLTPRIGARLAALACFVVSGLLHDLVLSVPAGGGYGLPTLYFLIQAAGASVERSHTGRRLGLGKGLPGWLFTVAITLGPVPLLFHPPFLERVVIPLLGALGAL